MTNTQHTPAARFNAINSRYATREKILFLVDSEGSNNWTLHVDGVKYEIWNTTLVVTTVEGHVIDVQQFDYIREAIHVTEHSIYAQIEARRANF